MKTLKLTKKYETYSEYKDSGVDWLGKIPKEWRIGKTKEVFNLIKERSFNNSELEVLSLTLQGIKVRDVSNNEGQIAASYEGYRRIFKGDIVLNPMDLIRGFVDSSKFEGIISPAYSTLRKREKETDSQFYNYFFQKHYFEGIFYPHGNGVSVDHRWTLKDDTLINFPILTTPIEQQKKIANYLDEKTSLIDQSISKKQKLIELLREKRTAVINQAVTKGLDQNVEMLESGVEWIGKISKGWSVEKLKFVSEMNKCTLGENTDPEFSFKYFDISAVDGEKESNVEDEMVFGKAPSRARRIIQAGNSIIATVRTYLKAIAYFDKVETNTIASTGFAVLSPKEKILPKYLYYYLQSDRFINEVIIRSKGVSYPAITPFDLVSLEIIYSSIKEQQNIVNYLDEKVSKINQLLEKVEKSIELLQEFKSSLISKVGTGKVKV